MTSEIIDKNKPLVHLAVRGSYTGWVLGHYGKEYGYDMVDYSKLDVEFSRID